MKSLKLTSSAFLLLALLFVSPNSFAQETEEDEPVTRKEKIKQLKIAFITKELALSSEQAEKFWPVYNEMNKKVNEQKKSRRKTAQDLKTNLETLSESDIKTKTNSVLDADIKIAELKKEYNEKIAAIISYKKATKLLSLETRFKRELLKKLNESEPGGTTATPRPRKPGQNGQRRRPN